MGREIKFRGKRKDNGKWTYGDLIQLLGEQGGGRKFIVDNRFGACIDENGDFVNTEAPFVNEVDPETVGQYTGLKDKNGREIFEGDATKDEFDRVAIITWKENEARFAMRYVGQKTEYRMFINHLQMEVIGSVYENSELLEV